MVPPPTQTHTHIYKILTTAPPDPLPTTLPLSSLDKSSGYIHLSTASQVPVTADRFFSDATELWVLKIAVKDVEGGLKWEDADGERFPHLYGGDLGGANVKGVEKIERGEGKWGDGVKLED